MAIIRHSDIAIAVAMLTFSTTCLSDYLFGDNLAPAIQLDRAANDNINMVTGVHSALDAKQEPLHCNSRGLERGTGNKVRIGSNCPNMENVFPVGIPCKLPCKSKSVLFPN